MSISTVFGRMLLVISHRLLRCLTQTFKDIWTMQQHKKVYLLTNQLERVVSGEIYFFYIYFGVQNVNIFVSHFRHFHYKLYYLHLTIDWNCYADKIICNENNIWKMQHKNIFLDKGKKPEKCWTENEHEFMFSLVTNNFLLMFTVAAQAVWLWGSWHSRQDASLGETRNISPLQSPRDLCPIWLLHSSTCHPVLQVNKANTR